MHTTAPMSVGGAPTLADPGSRASAPGAVPQRLGRYLVLHELGRGGMGAVYVAYDPELDRKVAVKLLGGGGDDPARQTRLQREAQAMARLAHPNVVTVFDVGVIDGEIYVAMEYVEGESLRAWLATPRPWRAVIEAFVQAGRGLAAAHAVGLVHRDFKPENAMVGRDGRVRVLDFGLAALGEALGAAVPADMPLQTAETDARTSGRSLLSSRLTAAGAIVGTLVYMSPEQMAGASLDGRSDQFSFCVALYEALFGALPFDGGSVQAYALAAASGEVRPSPRSEVPRTVQRAVLRGLATAPEQRHPDMPALLAELARDPAATRRRWLLGLGAGALSLGLGAGLYAAATGDDAACSGVGEPVAAVWNAARRAEVTAAFTAVGGPLAAETLARALPGLDAWAARWTAVHGAACQARRRGELSEARFDLESACLRGQVNELAARARIFAAADAAAVEHAVAAVEGLPDPQRCRVAPEAAKEPGDAALAARLVEADAEYDLGHYAQARALASAAGEAGEAAGDRVAAIEARLIEGKACFEIDEPQRGRDLLVRAFTSAAAASDGPRAFESARALLSRLTDVQKDSAQAALWGELAAAFGEQIAIAGTMDEVALLTAQANLAGFEGDHPRALATIARAEERAAALVDADSYVMASIVSLRARLTGNSGDAAAAAELHARARALNERALGPNHPDLAALANNLGTALEDLGRDDEAEREYLRALEFNRRVGQPHALRDSFVYNNLASLYARRGEYERAEAMARRALAVGERVLGPSSPHTAHTLNTLGNILLEQEHLADARPMLERALAIYEATLGEDHVKLSPPLLNLGYVAFQTGDFAAAERCYGRVVAIGLRASGPDDPEVGVAQFWHGRALAALGRRDEAIAAYERALAAWRVRPFDPDRRGDARFALALALWEREADRPRALAEARAAADLLRGADGWHVFTAAEVEAWIAARARRRR